MSLCVYACEAEDSSICAKFGTKIRVRWQVYKVRSSHLTMYDANGSDKLYLITTDNESYTHTHSQNVIFQHFECSCQFIFKYILSKFSVKLVVFVLIL